MTTHTPNHDEIDDAVRRVRGGDTGAFEAVVRKWERPLRAWLAACGPPGVDVDEVAQRSFIAAFFRLDEYRTGTDFGAWLFTIARFQLNIEATRLRRVADYHARYGLDLLQRELDRRCNEAPELDQVRLEHLRKASSRWGSISHGLSLGDTRKKFHSTRWPRGAGDRSLRSSGS